MTTNADRLHEVIEQADRHALVELLAPLDEETRAGLAPIAGKAFADAKRRHDELLYGHVPDASDMAEAREWFERMKTAALAWLGTGDIAEFPAQREYSHPKWYERFDFARAFDIDELHRILLDRRPPWLAALAAQYITDHRWDAAWRLVLDGALARPTGEAYLLGMADHAAWGPEPGLADMVLRDPALLTVDLPALLKLPDGLLRIVSRDIVAGSSARRQTWSPVLNAHFPPGHPIRDRILDQLLELLTGDLNGPDATRLRKFLDKLAATPSELAARQQALFALVGHRIPAVVSYSVRALARLGRANLIPPTELIDAVEPALLAPAKSTATTALAIVASALRRDPGVERRAVERFATAVAHPHAEVQLAGIEAVAPHLVAHPDIAARLSELLPELSATAAQRLRTALPHQPTAEPPTPAVDLDDLIRRSEKVPPEVAHTCGVDAAIEAVRQGNEPPAVQVRPGADAGAAEIRPVSGVDELIRVLLRVVNGRGGIVDLERALDGLASIGPRWPSDFGRRVGPLLARVNQHFERDAPDWGERASGDMCLLVASWIEPQRGAGPAHPMTSPGIWLTSRIREVALGLGDPDPRPLLALPTDRRGWIDPTILVKRAGAGGGEIKRPIDTAVALARLAPSGRAAALHQAADLPGPLGRAVRAALGGDDDPSELPDVVADVIGWLRDETHESPPRLFGAAERDEAPRVTSEELAIEVNEQLRHMPPIVDANGELSTDLSQLPAYREMRVAYAYECAQRYAPDWAATLWPGDHRWLWRDATTTAVGLRLLLDPHEPVPPEALVAMIRHVSHEKPEERTLAVDVLIQTIGDARVTSTELARSLLTTVEGATDVSSARLVTLLQETAAASALHRATVRAALIDMLPTWLDRLAGQQRYGPLALLDEMCAADGTPITQPKTCALLNTLATGRSKSAAIARRLLDRSPAVRHVRSNTSAWPADALAAALNARIERAEH
ncbi:hypothetical protein GCM10023194_30970 [Planotetraspora phitsanulokensis]|uniref:DUF6493 domain-containing protein n=1 Tax=Planotetraspora phitsanulokensis TaxID=575192 RepID=A0A8J3XC81_9ACTN|nr:DUF6493 family protein [Planotetraspora phitsanulokensis]GII35765.1 hypothetical protein Pph01_07680 [Planotetraspora phitsanulokensis]